MVAQMMKSSGGYIMALKQLRRRYSIRHGRSLQSHHPASPRMATLSNPKLPHGTFTRQIREHPKGNPTSTNSIAPIFTWTRGLARRGKVDETLEALAFTESLENACVDTVNVDGIMTKNLAIACGKIGKIGKEDYVNTTEFMDAVETRVKMKLKERL